ncbi:MAG: hypothetical protein K6B12_05260, partial [Clostridiales bacterium]|nr:hypothetical protein [Clostridiales bacterium]
AFPSVSQPPENINPRIRDICALCCFAADCRRLRKMLCFAQNHQLFSTLLVRRKRKRGCLQAGHAETVEVFW